MKGPNPFNIYEIDPDNIVGRKEEIRVFNSFIKAAAGNQPGMLLVRGVPGIGKSTMLRYFSHLARKEGLVAPYIKIEKGETMEALVDKLFQETRAIPKLELGSAPRTLPELLSMLNNEKYFGSILFIDDIDRMKKSSEAIEEIKNAGVVSFVLSSTRDVKIDRKMVLMPFEEHEARELVEKALGKSPRMGEECFNSIMNDSDGNPRIFKTVCHHIYDRLRDNEKIISKGHYLAYLPHIMNMLGREWFGWMYQNTPKSEKEILEVIAKNDEMHVSEIARELSKSMGPVTALVKRLLERGQIVKVDRGRYRIFAKLYGKYVISRS